MPTHKNKLVCTSNPSRKVTQQNVQLSVTLDRAIRILRCEGIPQFLSSLIAYLSSGLENVSNPAGSRVAYSSESRQVWVARQRAEHEFLPTRIADDHPNKRSETFSRQSMTEVGGEVTVGVIPKQVVTPTPGRSAWPRLSVFAISTFAIIKSRFWLIR